MRHEGRPAPHCLHGPPLLALLPALGPNGPPHSLAPTPLPIPHSPGLCGHRPSVDGDPGGWGVRAPPTPL